MTRPTLQDLSMTEILALAEQVEEGLAALRRKETLAVVFVDLVGSTEFKDGNPNEDVWLPRLATFLQSASNILSINGNVVKYIGDEVMATFPEPDGALHAEHAAEEIYAFCRRFTKYQFQVKIALDYGTASLVTFGSNDADDQPWILRDPQGMIVDRCARIIGRALPNTVLCSRNFFEARSMPRRWRRCGSFQAKGLRKKVEVFQLELEGSGRVEIGNNPMPLPECLKKLKELEGVVAAMKELQR